MNNLNYYLITEGKKVKGFESKSQLLENPLYNFINNWKLSTLEYMSPKKYLEIIAKNFGISYKDTIDSPHVSQENVEKYAEEMKKGAKFPIGFYTVDKNSQEGRHRALAAMKAGIKEIPVVRIEHIEDRDVIQDFVRKYKDLDKRGLEKATKDIWPDGLSNLDWNEFSRYRDYSLD